MNNKKKVDVDELLHTLEGKSISQVKSQVKDPDRISVFVSGRFVFGLSKWLALDLGLKADLVLDKELLARLKESILEEQVHRFFLNILSRREHAAQELIVKGQRKGFSNAILQKVIEDFKSKDLQSDERFTSTFVRSKHLSGWGPQKIRLYLQKHRINRQLIEENVSNIELSEEEELDQLKTLVLKKKGSWAKLDNQKLKEKIYRHLLQKGFKGNRILAKMNDLVAHLRNT